MIGLTSARNVDFLERLGLYPRVVPYDDVASLRPARTVYLDVASDAELRSAIHRHAARRSRGAS